ncbi:unnamed protein product [Staurois parvus]|uniref:Uncharacterized protein n=1 Tax=Staurois parvus TaxID=386267 RepID=A0ABN9CQ52_9NEOB|nr:unnamed protein product [Staurois parvus]
MVPLLKVPMMHSASSATVSAATTPATKCPLRRNSHSQSDHTEIITKSGAEHQEDLQKIAKHSYCTYYPVSSSIELPQTAC